MRLRHHSRCTYVPQPLLALLAGARGEAWNHFCLTTRVRFGRTDGEFAKNVGALGGRRLVGIIVVSTIQALFAPTLLVIAMYCRQLVQISHIR